MQAANAAIKKMETAEFQQLFFDELENVYDLQIWAGALRSERPERAENLARIFKNKVGVLPFIVFFLG